MPRGACPPDGGMGEISTTVDGGPRHLAAAFVASALPLGIEVGPVRPLWGDPPAFRHCGGTVRAFAVERTTDDPHPRHRLGRRRGL